MKRIKQNTFYKYKFISDLKSNNKYTQVGFLVSEIKEATNSYHKSLWLYDGSEPKLFKKSVSSFIFDENDLIIQETKDDETVINTVFSCYDVVSGEKTDSLEFPLDVNSIKALGNYQYLIEATTDLYCPNYYLLSEEDRQIYLKDKIENEKYQIIDEYPFFFNGQGYVNKTRNSLYIYNKQDDSLKRITSATIDVEGVDICKNLILFSGYDFDDYKTKNADVYQYNIVSDELSVLYDKKDMMIHRTFFLDHQPMVAGTFGLEIGFMENPKFYTITDNELVHYLDSDISLYNSVGSDCRLGSYNNYINYQDKPYFIGTSGDSSMVFKLDRELECVVSEVGSTDAVTFLNGEIITIGMYQMKLQEVYACIEGKTKQITHFNDKIKKEYYIAEPIKCVVENEFFDIEGYVLLPYNYDDSKKYPVILDIHGGPKTSYGAVFYHEMQYWASLGYFVIFSNPRGSDGKGNRFADLRGGIGSIGYRDIMKFQEDIVKKYKAIDTSRMAVTGGSYGGYMTNYIIGQTDRFKCAISQRSISNWISMVTASDYGIDFPIEQEYKDIYNCHDELWDESPLKYANNIVTPTLFIHSYEDYRCPFAEALQIYTVLKCRGIDSRVCGFKEENHELSRSGKPKARTKRLEEITNWIIKYTGEEKK